MVRWSERDIPDLTGKVIIVTGANSGLGYQNSKQFAKKGATVIMACRNQEKGEKALQKLKNRVRNADIELMHLDLGSLVSIEKFANEFKEKYDRLDVLLNNAGIMMVPYAKTTDGFERQIGINHLGHFALTAQLYNVLLQTNGARVVNVSSIGHHLGSIDWDNFMFDRDYSPEEAYYRSKLANLLFTFELDRRFKAKNLPIKSVASHPGVSDTHLGDHLFGRTKYLLWPFLMLFYAQTASRGALSSSRAATDPLIKGGEYYGPRGFRGSESRGSPKLAEINDKALSTLDAQKLWEVSEDLTRIQFDI